MKKSISIFILLLISCNPLIAQVSINSTGNLPDLSAGLDVNFTGKGMLIPRMTQSEIEAITTPANGLVVFCSTCDKFFVFLLSQNKWKEIAYGPYTINPGGGFSCGNSIIINHLASGGVAPVDKSVTYGTISNIPGEPSKCWITSNLGSDHQANAIDDATEASAGWYWQFNLKQGYKHDGTTRSPGNPWITSINETLDWQAANDPCTLELGGSWRIPTVTEWTHADAGGNWTNPNGPWNSDLKLHKAGYLLDNNGSLEGRSTNGIFWSGTESSSGKSWALYFWNTSCFIDEYNKTYGFSLRCITD